MEPNFDFLKNIIGLIFVGVIWGITNPYMEKGTQGSEEKTDSKIDFSWKSFIKTISKLKFLIPFGLNQSGSLLYYFLLGRISSYYFWSIYLKNSNIFLDLSIAPLIVNSVNCMVTYLAENHMKRQSLTKGLSKTQMKLFKFLLI
jgi:hypothetical protein